MSYKIKTNEGTWTCNEISSDTLHSVLLADILSELKTLNRTLNCHRVPAMADAMIRVDERLKRNGLSLAKRNRK